MREFTLEQYQRMSKRFNKMSFDQKIKTIIDNKDILTLASDGNWWGVKAKDFIIEEQLFNSETGFIIENEWGSNEMFCLINILGISNTDI